MSKREIKFRAWDPDKGAMADVWKIEFRAWRNDSINDLVLHAGELSDGGTYSPEFVHRIILMQYTGLKDRNGVEIYEADVIDGKWPYARRGIVTWDNARCGFFIAPFDADGKPGGRAAYDKGYKMNAAKVSIIGNIYQNPELLQQ